MDEVRIDVHRLRADRREQFVEWVRSLGVDPRDVCPTALIRSGAREYELHLSRYMRDEQGHMVIDRARDEVATEPLVLTLGTKPCWPSRIGIVLGDSE